MSNLRSAFVILVAIAFGFAHAACNVMTDVPPTHPSTETAVQEEAFALCAKDAECDTTFAQRYPEGVDQCTKQFVAETMSKIGPGDDACSSDELTTCTSDLQSLSCSDFVTMRVRFLSEGAAAWPASCQKC